MIGKEAFAQRLVECQRAVFILPPERFPLVFPVGVGVRVHIVLVDILPHIVEQL